MRHAQIKDYIDFAVKQNYNIRVMLNFYVFVSRFSSPFGE